MARVTASERTRNELKKMMAGESVYDRSSMVRQAARLIVEEALEAEAEEALGRGYYKRGAQVRGYRNGYRTGRVKSAEGAIEFAMPQVSDTAEPFRSNSSERPLDSQTLTANLHNLTNTTNETGPWVSAWPFQGLPEPSISAAFHRVAYCSCAPFGGIRLRSNQHGGYVVVSACGPPGGAERIHATQGTLEGVFLRSLHSDQLADAARERPCFHLPIRG